VLGVPFAGALAVLVGLFDLLPLVGATIAAFLVGIVTVFSDFPTDTIIWIVFAIAYQQFENYVIQPQIQKRAVELEPFVVLVAVLFGGTLFGVIGALLAIPIAATIQIAVQEWWRYRLDRRLTIVREGGEPGGGGGGLIVPRGDGPDLPERPPGPPQAGAEPSPA
jgi:predicted PurR-regulated permease PerM